jgi:hypothetical protein
VEEIYREIGGVRRILYFGDLDAPGLQIPQRASRTAAEAGLPTIEPHLPSYRWLLDLAHSTRNSDETLDRQVCDWLQDLAEPAWALLSAGKRIAQERIGWQFLQEKTTAELRP